MRVFVVLAVVMGLVGLCPASAHAQPLTTGGFTTDSSVEPTRVTPGGLVTLTASVTSTSMTTALVDIEVYNASGQLVKQTAFDAQSFVAGQTRSYRVPWTVPTNEPEGVHTVRIGIFNVAWGSLRHWNNSAGMVNVAVDHPDRKTVMPLGDSLTDGYNIPGGYRIDLSARFVAGSLSMDFVGSLMNGPPGLTDRDHEGHSGWRIDEISGSVGGWLNAYRPDIVLLMIGTNDVVQNYQLGTAPDRLSALVDQIIAVLPTSQVIVASIPRIGGATNLQRVQAYNATIPGIVNAKAAQGKHVSFADMYSVVTDADLWSDYTHMAASGNTKLADLWYASIRSALGLPPATDTTSPGVTSAAPVNGATGVATDRNVVATFSEPVDATTVTSTTFELRQSAGTVVPAQVTYDAATRTVTLDPSATLAGTSTYTARIRGGATDPRVKDLAGNALAEDFSWSFTTGTGPGYMSGGYTTSAAPSPPSALAGASVQVPTMVTSAATGTVLVDLEIYGPTGAKVFQQAWDSQAIAAGQTRTYTTTWAIPTTAAAGTYAIRVGVFKAGWGLLYHWNSSAGQVSVSR